MTKNQRIKFFGASDTDKKIKRSAEERVNEFLAQDSINALGVAMYYDAIILLYEKI